MRAFEDIAKTIVAKLGISPDQRVLEIGSDFGGGLALEVAKHAREVIGTNIVGKPKELGPNCRFAVDDIRASQFKTGEFDAIVSYATFEHIHSFDQALSEMARLLKPGGWLYSSFGPIWSCPWGHHLWVRVGERVITYDNTPLPSHCHLLMSEKALRTELATRKTGQDEADSIVEFIFRSPEQNRLLHDDYVKAFDNSTLAVQEWHSGSNRKLEQLYGGAPSGQLLQRLKRKCPGNSDFTSSSITVLAKAAS